MDLLALAADDKDTFQIIFGWLGNALALFFYFSPIVIMTNLIKGKIEYTTIPVVLLLANVLNCLLWTVYGIDKDDYQIYGCNAIGGTMSLVYLTIYWYFFIGKHVAKYIGIAVGSFIVLGGIWALFTYVITDVDVVGYVAMVFNIVMYASPGQKIIEVIKKGDYTLIPFLPTVLGLCCSTCWLIYGLYGALIPVIIPNALGVLFSVVNIGCWIFYYRKAKSGPSLEPFMGDQEKNTLGNEN